jgi:LmbE family N-acetylglucosaminyl deacetylase
MPEDWDTALAVVAHPDDLEYGVASAIARWTGQDKRVAYALASSGEAGIEGLSPEQAGPLREQEERTGAAIVGVDDVQFLGLADGTIEWGLELRRLIAREIRRVRPQVVVTINFELTWGFGEGTAVNHSDHRAVGLAVLDACRDAANRWLFRDDGEPWSGVQGVYVAATEPATHYVDVSDTMDAAVDSLRAHAAYLDGLGGNVDPDAMLRGWARESGALVGCDLAVLFRRYDV